MKETYTSKQKARDVALAMIDRSASPVWMYPVPGGWQVTGRGDLVTSKAIMPPLPMFTDTSRTSPKYHRGHRPRKVFRVAWCNDGFTQMHQPIDGKRVARALMSGSAVVVVMPRNGMVEKKDILNILRPHTDSNFIAISQVTWRHFVLIANRVQRSALADIYDTVVLHQILGSPGQLFTGVTPYGYDTGE